MFELEPAVNQWCAEVSRRITDSDDLRAELKDHLYCEIESLRDQGLSEEQAFRLAVQKLGDPTELVSEYRENRRLLSVFCKAADPSLNVYSQQRSNIMTYRQNVKRILTQSLLWATAIVTSGLLLGEAEQYFTYMLLLVVLATVSIGIDPGYREAARVECAYLKKLFTGRKAS